MASSPGREPPSSQTEVQPSVPAAGLSSQLFVGLSIHSLFNTTTNDIMASSQCQEPPSSQTEVQPSVPAAGLPSQPGAQCNLVLNDANLLTMILIIAASTGLHRSHKIFMVEACNTTIGEIAQQKRDKLRACMRQVCCQASADARV